MGATYTPTYYTSLHESITAICKTILPFSFKKRRVPAIAAAEQRLSEQQSENLKWQQESFHQMLKLMALCKEGIVGEDEVSDFRAHVVENITGLPVDYEAPVILRDKLIFLQLLPRTRNFKVLKGLVLVTFGNKLDLFYANCITEEEYHLSKRPLLQRLSVQGAKIRESDVIAHNGIPNEEWSVLYLKENKRCTVTSERLMLENKPKEGPSINNLKGDDSSVSALAPPVISTTKFWGNELLSSKENPFWNCHLNENESESKSILMMETLLEVPAMPEKKSGNEKGKRKPFSALFRRSQKEGVSTGLTSELDPVIEEKQKSKLVKSQWGFDKFKNWMKNESEHETTPLSHTEKSDDTVYNNIGVVQPKNSPENEKTKEKSLLHQTGSQPDFNEVLGFKTEHSKDDKIDEIPMRHPVDKADPKKFSLQYTTEEKHGSRKWTTFDDEENEHPNLFSSQAHISYNSMKQDKFSSSSMIACASLNISSSNSSIDMGFRYNPFFELQDY